MEPSVSLIIVRTSCGGGPPSSNIWRCVARSSTSCREAPGSNRPHVEFPEAPPPGLDAPGGRSERTKATPVLRGGGSMLTCQAPRPLRSRPLFCAFCRSAVLAFRKTAGCEWGCEIPCAKGSYYGCSISANCKLSSRK